MVYQILSVGRLISAFYLVYRFISSVNDLKSNTQWSHRNNLYKIAMQKVLIDEPFAKANLA